MMERSKSLAPHTGKVFEIISQLECIKPYTLVGGTALSLQIEKRQSEDLDFMKWLTKRNEKPEADWPAIKKELESVGEIREYEVGSFDFVSFNFEGVKLSFYAAPRKAVPSMQRIQYLNNLYIADMESIGAMKMEAMLRRSKFRDYYKNHRDGSCDYSFRMEHWSSSAICTTKKIRLPVSKAALFFVVLDILFCLSVKSGFRPAPRIWGQAG